MIFAVSLGMIAGHFLVCMFVGMITILAIVLTVFGLIWIWDHYTESDRGSVRNQLIYDCKKLGDFLCQVGVVILAVLGTALVGFVVCKTIDKICGL